MFKNLLKNRRASGFTIIEVMIVLAIAGLIMVVVLVAVPQLQRNQRNSASRAVLDRVFTELQNYATNNNGRMPDDDTRLLAFCNRYLEKTSATTCNEETGAAFLNDPRTGTRVRLVRVAAVATAPTNLPTDGTSRTISVYAANTGSGFRCDGEAVVAGTGARQVAAVIPLEGGAFACRDNQ